MRPNRAIIDALREVHAAVEQAMSAAAAIASTGLGCSVSTVKRQLHELVAARLITRTRRLNRTSLRN